MVSDVAAVAFLSVVLMFFPCEGSGGFLSLCMEHRTDSRNAPTMVCAYAQILDRAREMSRERSRGQPRTIRIGSVEPREWNAPGSHDDGFPCEHTPEAYARVSIQALKSGSSWRVIPSSVRKD